MCTVRIKIHIQCVHSIQMCTHFLINLIQPRPGTLFFSKSGKTRNVSHNVTNAPKAKIFLELRPGVKVTVIIKQSVIHPDPKDVSTHQSSYLKAWDTIFLELRPEVKVTVTRKTVCDTRRPKMHPHTKFEGSLP